MNVDRCTLLETSYSSDKQPSLKVLLHIVIQMHITVLTVVVSPRLDKVFLQAMSGIKVYLMIVANVMSA